MTSEGDEAQGPAAAPRQLSLDFPETVLSFETLVRTPANAAAIDRLERFAEASEPWLAVIGPPLCGLTTLARLHAERSGAARLCGPDLNGLSAPEIDALARQGVAIDGADRIADSMALLELLNAVREHDSAAVLFGHTPPGSWAQAPGDLTTRLKSMAVVEILPPDEAMMKARLGLAFQRRFMHLTEDVARYLVRRLPRTYAELEAFAARAANVVEEQARSLTVPLARSILAQEAETGDLFEDGQDQAGGRDGNEDGR